MLSHRLRSMPPICKYKGVGLSLGGFYRHGLAASAKALSQRHGVSAAKPLRSNARDLSSGQSKEVANNPPVLFPCFSGIQQYLCTSHSFKRERYIYIYIAEI